MKEILYYVIKYGDQYVAPYITTDYLSMFKIDGVLSPNRKLAVRFPTKEVAEYFFDWQNLVFAYDPIFDKTKTRIVSIVKKT